MLWIQIILIMYSSTIRRKYLQRQVSGFLIRTIINMYIRLVMKAELMKRLL